MSADAPGREEDFCNTYEYARKGATRGTYGKYSTVHTMYVHTNVTSFAPTYNQLLSPETFCSSIPVVLPYKEGVKAKSKL